jgi:hypothetical protein
MDNEIKHTCYNCGENATIQHDIAFSFGRVRHTGRPDWFCAECVENTIERNRAKGADVSELENLLK